MSFEIVKAGWLFRQSSVLKRWKKNWFVLYQDCILKYFDSPDSHVAEDVIRMQAECIAIHSGDMVNATPPEGHGKSCLIKITGRDDKLWVLCAESPDDMSAWKYSLEQARLIPSAAHQNRPNAPPSYSATEWAPSYPQGPPAYPQGAAAYPQQTAYPQQQVAYAYPRQNYYGSNPPEYIVQSPPGQTTVIYADDRRYRRGYDGTDMAMGMVAGAAIGSMMWGPMLWW